MPLTLIILGLFASLLLAAALFDLFSYTIPNRLTGSMLALFAVFLVASAMSGHSLGWFAIELHLLAGLIALAAGMTLFAPGWIGGGDAKFFAVVCLWLGWHEMLEYALVASLMGGALTVAILGLRSIPLPATVAVQPWMARLADSRAGVPYGVALGLAALRIVPDSDLVHLALS